MSESVSGTRDQLPDSPQSFEALGAVASLLWREREVLELVLFKLVEEQLILVSGRTRWLPKADDEVRAAAQTLRGSEVVRAAEVDLLVRTFGLSAETSLRELAEMAPEPWPMLLNEHRSALIALSLEIDVVVAENRRLLHSGEQATRDTLDHLTGRISTYDSRGEFASAGGSALILDQQA
jgi:hypothetical protein